MADQSTPGDQGAGTPATMTASLAEFLDSLGVRYRRVDDAPMVLTAIDGYEVVFEFTPGMLHVFLQLIDTEQETEGVEAEVLLEQAAPIPVEFMAVAEYRPDGSGHVGLYQQVAMPLTFNGAGTLDALWLIGQAVNRMSNRAS